MTEWPGEVEQSNENDLSLRASYQTGVAIRCCRCCTRQVGSFTRLTDVLARLTCALEMEDLARI